MYWNPAKSCGEGRRGPDMERRSHFYKVKNIVRKGKGWYTKGEYDAVIVIERCFKVRLFQKAIEKRIYRKKIVELWAKYEA